MAEKKLNFDPPGWLVCKFDTTLPKELAIRFDALRRKLVAPLDPEDHTGYEYLHHNELIVRAVEIMVDIEEAWATKQLPYEQGSPMTKIEDNKRTALLAAYAENSLHYAQAAILWRRIGRYMNADECEVILTNRANNPNPHQ